MLHLVSQCKHSASSTPMLLPDETADIRSIHCGLNDMCTSAHSHNCTCAHSCVRTHACSVLLLSLSLPQDVVVEPVAETHTQYLRGCWERSSDRDTAGGPLRLTD